MSSGPTITMSEGNIENIKLSNPAMMFHTSSKKEGLLDGNSGTMEAEAKANAMHLKAQNHAPKEKSIITQGEAGDVPSNGPNHVLRPAKIENMENSLKKQMSGKSPYIIKTKAPAPMIIGASGDGFPPKDKIMLRTNQNCVATTNHKEADNSADDTKLQTTNTTQENTRISYNKTSVQTYAKAAQSSPANSKTNEVKSEICAKSENTSQSNYLKTSKVQDPAPVMNGGLEEDVPPVTSEAATSQSNTDNTGRALKETIGHISRLPNEASNARSNNDGRVGEQDIQILPNPERAMEESQYSQDISSVNSEGDASVASKLNNNGGPPRRETEKPPRMQKQRSQDRLLLKQQQKASFDADTKREALSRESSFECVDSTGVDVHEFLINTLRNSTRDRAILLKIEHDMIDFINNKTIDFMKFPPMTSYHRMLVHRVAAYFGMDHNVDETGKSVIINKTSSTRLPEIRFADHFDPRQTDQHSGRRDDDMRRRSILKRTNQSRSFDRDDMKGGGSWKDRQRSIEEREEAYEKVRARIFNNPEAGMNSPMYGRRGISSMAAARMASWSDRPWNSTEMDLSMRMQGPRPLTTRASSYSSILPRHNSATSVKTGSSSSISSMNGGMQNFPQGRQPPLNMGPRPPTPGRRNGMGDNNNGTYYYMQHQNQGMPYLSPEGYQLVYQSNPASGGGGGMQSPQFARYYQMPPQPSPHHPGMAAYPQGYNPYEESPQKGQGSNGSEYSMMSPMSTYPHNMSSTTTVYSGVQGQPNLSYAYQPTAIYRPTSEPPPPMGSNPPTQPVMQGVPQGKQTPGMQSSPNFIPHPPGTPGYPPYVVAPNPAVPPQTSAKEGGQHGTVTPKAVMTQPVPVMQQMVTPPGYPQQVVFPHNAGNPSQIAVSNEGYSSTGQNDPSKSSNSTQAVKKTEDELSEKMQAIVLKNMQQQGQIHDPVASESTITVTTSLSPSTIPVQNTKAVPDVANQSRVSAATHHRHPSETHGYQFHYTNANGVPHPQPMQVYLMPANSAGTSYRTYSQFMTQPQTPHVMGPGMQFVYLSPPMGGVMGLDSSGAVATPSNVPVYHPAQMQQPVRQASESSAAYVSNTNNNNAANSESLESVGHLRDSTPNSDNAAGTNTSTAQNGALNADGQMVTENAKTLAVSLDKDKKVEAKPDSNNAQDLAVNEAQSNAVLTIEQTSENHEKQTSTAELNQVRTPNAPPSSSNNQPFHVHSHPVAQHPTAPVLLSNVPQSYAGQVSYPAGVIPQYPMYPGTPYVYLPTAATRGQKMSDMKMYPAQAAQSPSPGLIAVQFPNQNQIQFVPAASLHHQNQVYYTPHNYVPTDYTSHAQVPVPTSAHQTSRLEASPQTDAALQANDAVSAENTVSMLQDSKADDSGQGSMTENLDALKPEEPISEVAGVAVEKQ